MANMAQLMENLRTAPPSQIAGLPVLAVRDYGNQLRRAADGGLTPLDAPRGNMLILDLALPGQTTPSGNAVAVRPSGTEPKIKFYVFGFESISGREDLASGKKRLQERVDRIKMGLRQQSA
jgi:phosphoglucomutase